MAGGYAHQPQGIEAIVAEFRKIRKLQDDLSRRITSLGITIDPQGNLIFGAAGKDVIIKGGSGLDIQDDGTLHVAGATTLDGDLTATAGTLKSGNYVAGASGWRLQPSGNVEINDLTLRGGIIGDAALAHPITPQINYADNNGTSMPGTGGSDLAAGTIAIPAGFSQVATLCTITVGTTRSSSTPDGFAIQAWTEMQEDPANWYWVSSTVSTMCPGSGYTSFSISGVGLYSNIPSGWHLRYGAWVAANDSAGGWATNATNAHASLLALFFR